MAEQSRGASPSARGTATWALGLAIASAVVLVLGACSSSEPEDPAAFCDVLRQTSARNGNLTELELDDPARLEAALVDLTTLVELAPAEIKDDVTVVANVLNDVLTSLASTAPGAQGAVLAELQPRIDTAEAPSAALQRYGETTCQLTFNAPAHPTPTPTPLDIDD